MIHAQAMAESATAEAERIRAEIVAKEGEIEIMVQAAVQTAMDKHASGGATEGEEGAG